MAARAAKCSLVTWFLLSLESPPLSASYARPHGKRIDTQTGAAIPGWYGMFGLPWKAAAAGISVRQIRRVGYRGDLGSAVGPLE